MYVFYRSRNNAKDPNGQFCYKFLRLYKMICWIRHIFSFRIHDSLLMLWESLIHDFLPSIGFLCGERRSSIQTDLVIRFHAAAQRKIICSILTGITSFFSGVFSWVGKMISFHYLATAWKRSIFLSLVIEKWFFFH